MGFYNPFHDLIENATYPAARTLRTSFRQKLSDTFHVFAGSFFRNRNNHVGLFDYATLMIPYSVTRTVIDMADSPSLANLIPIIPFGAIALTTAIVRYSVASVMTAVVSPLVGATHLFSMLKGNNLKNKTNKLQIIENPNNKEIVDHQQSSLGKFLNTKRKTLENIDVDFVGTYKKFKLLVTDKPDNSMFDCGYGVCKCCPDPEKHVIASSDFNLNNKNDRKNFKTLLKLNVGSITKKLERIGVNFKFFKKSVSCDEKEEVNTYERSFYN